MRQKKTIKVLDDKKNQLNQKIENVQKNEHVIQELGIIKELVSKLENQIKKASEEEKNVQTVKINKKMTKDELYQKERDEIVIELEKKMGLNETNRGVLLYDLEHNETLKKYLKDKIVDIQKFYKCAHWNYFKKLSSDSSKVDEIGLLKSIFKSENYNITNKRIIKEINNVKKLYSVLYFYKQ